MIFKKLYVLPPTQTSRDEILHWSTHLPNSGPMIKNGPKHLQAPVLNHSGQDAFQTADLRSDLLSVSRRDPRWSLPVYHSPPRRQILLVAGMRSRRPDEVELPS